MEEGGSTVHLRKRVPAMTMVGTRRAKSFGTYVLLRVAPEHAPTANETKQTGRQKDE